MSSVTFENVKKAYGDTEVVKQFDLHINAGEFVVFLGPSGCGKSTTLRMLAGLESISSGDIKIGDRRVNDLHPKDRNTAMVFQSYALYPHMTVEKNIGFPLKMAGAPKAEIAQHVKEIAESLELTPLLKRYPKALSGGQRQRVAMGRAMVRVPSVFLFDEPLSNLDTKLRGTMRAEIKAMHQKIKTTTLYVTHDQVEAMSLADRVVILKDGYVAQVGSPKEIFESPRCKFVATFIGAPEMNIFKANATSVDNTVITVEEQTIPLHGQHPIQESTIEYGIRPSDFYLNKQAIQSDAVGQLNVTVDMVELLGSNYHLHCTVGEQSLLAEVESPSALEELEGKEVTLFFDKNRTHLFGSDGQAIKAHA
ncbi:ABC transporter ATP-binding protein [Vibrio campbellii]